METVLLVEDEVMLGQIVKDSLEVRGFNVVHAKNGLEGLNEYQNLHPDILVVDIMMPELDGFSLVEKIRESNKTMPVIFLTARSQTVDVVKGFELGGNDYLKKPFSMDELIVRIKSLLTRRLPVVTEPEYQIGNLLFDPARQKLLGTTGEEISLSHRESELLKLLYINRNNVLSRKQALVELWGDDSFFNGRSLDVFITKLRNHLKNEKGIQIVNIRGIGYKLIL